MQLRPYQAQAVSELRDALGTARSALLVMPTGAGKTVVFTEIARLATLKNKTVFILVHRRELIKQASDKLKAAGVEHGIISAGFKRSDSLVQVCSVQTLVRRLHTVDTEPDLLIIDEAHHAVAGSWEKVIQQFQNAKLVGVTATPCRLDGRGLGSHFSTLVQGPYVEQLVVSGYLSPHIVFAVPTKVDLTSVKIRGGDYATDQLSEAMNRPSITGDAVIQYKKNADGLPAIAFCCNIKHATSVSESFQDAGYRAKLVTGTMPKEERDDAISGLADGRTQILCSVDVVSEGTDVPAVSAAILLRPTQSEGLYLQQVGRILRPQPGKIAIVLDHVGSTSKHGFIDDRRVWSLDAKPKRQRQDEPAPSVRQCPKCFAAFKPRPVCPRCGHVFPVKVRRIEFRDGELVEMKQPWGVGDWFVFDKASDKLQYRVNRVSKKEEYVEYQCPRTQKYHYAKTSEIRRTQKASVKKEQGKARTLPELLAFAKEKGYKPGWAYKIYNARMN